MNTVLNLIFCPVEWLGSKVGLDVVESYLVTIVLVGLALIFRVWLFNLFGELSAGLFGELEAFGSFDF